MTKAIQHDLLAYLSLLLLLGLTILASRLPLHAWQLALSIGIALVKAGLVMVVFMRFRHKGAMTKLYFGLGFLWLTILFGLVVTDVLTRSPI